MGWYAPDGSGNTGLRITHDKRHAEFCGVPFTLIASWIRFCEASQSVDHGLWHLNGHSEKPISGARGHQSDRRGLCSVRHDLHSDRHGPHSGCHDRHSCFRNARDQDSVQR